MVAILDAAILLMLYERTGGAAWKNTTGWLDGATSACQWHGVKCAGGGLIGLSMNENSLGGAIPTQLGRLTGLTTLYVNQNELSGAIPTQLGGLTDLTVLYVDHNSLSGAIPTQLGRLAGLTTLKVDWNSLGGAIPTQFGGLTDLTVLYVDHNSLSGAIPTQLGGLTDLTALDASYNSLLSGAIPTQLGGLAGLIALYLGGNSLGGAIPTQLGRLAGLTTLKVDWNSLGGAIPTQFGGLTGLTKLETDHNSLSGAIPTQLGGLTGLPALNVKQNRLGGAIPTQLGRLTSLTTLEVEWNSLSGAIPTQLGGLAGLTDLEADNNSLSGAIPTQLGRLTDLTLLQVYSNSFSGAIPTQLGGLTGLTYLRATGNRFTYPPPLEVHALCSNLNLNVSCFGLGGCTPSSPCDGAVVNKGLCQNALQLCIGVADCSAFKQAIPSLADPTQCSACDHGTELLVLLPVALLLFACAGLSLLRRAACKHPQHVRRWLSTATIVYSHCLNVTLISSINIDWPPTMRRLARTLSLENILMLPGLECAVMIEDQHHLWSSLWSAVMQSTQVVIAIFLCLALTYRNTANSMRWLSLFLIFGFIGMWRAFDRLMFIVIVFVSNTRSWPNHGDWTTRAAIFAGCMGSMLCCISSAWALRLRHYANAYARGLTTGEWLWRSPLELDRRLAYLTHRFTSHAPNWQFALWLRQLLMLVVGSRAISMALETSAADCNDSSIGDTSGLSCSSFMVCAEEPAAAYTMCCACGGGTPAASPAVLGALSALPWVQLGLNLLIITVSLVWHHKRQPYAFASQNTLESGLLFSVALLLLLAILYHTVATTDGNVSPALDALMAVLVLGSLVSAALFAVLDWRRQQKDRAPLSLDDQLVGAAIPMHAHPSVSSGSVVLVDKHPFAQTIR
jgi:Leucine-rich repeat (LRR) protein